MVKKKRTSKSPKQAQSEPVLIQELPTESVIVDTSTGDVSSDQNNSNSCLLIVSDEMCDVVSTDVMDDLNASTSERSVPIFKDPNFVHSTKSGQANLKKTRSWKNVKQIIAAERMLAWGPDDVSYGSIDAPPSFKPAKKYSDVSGLVAKYTDPQSKLRYTTSEEFTHIRLLPADLVAGYLSLRKANMPVP
ncbi:INO80 complex subunit C [Chamberlinius hualienensis]